MRLPCTGHWCGVGCQKALQRGVWQWHATPAGLKLRGVYNLVFCPDAIDSGSELWHDPGVRRATAALVELYAERWPGSGDDASINCSDGELWACHFASSSYGDRLFARCLALLLLPAAPDDVQVGQ